MSIAHAAVVKNAPVRYKREIRGISMYLHHAKDNNTKQINDVRNPNDCKKNELKSLRHEEKSLPRHNIRCRSLLLHPSVPCSASEIHYGLFLC
jgi:hypothetical protein